MIIFFVAIVAILFLSQTARDYAVGTIQIVAAWVVEFVSITIGSAPALGAIILIVTTVWISFWALLGNFANAPTAGWIVGLGSLIGIFFFRGVMRPVAVIAILVIAFGFFFPEIKVAMNNYSANGQVVIANKIDTQSLQMEPQGVQLATITNDAVLYDNKGQPLGAQADKGTKVKTVSLERRQFSGGPQTFAKVMLPNIYGDYLGGSVGWVSIDKIAFVGSTVGAKPAPAAQEVTRTVYVPVPTKEVVYPISARLELRRVAKNKKDKYFLVESLKRTATILEMRCAYKLTFVGKAVGIDTYEGTWSQPGKKGAKFCLSFSDAHHASGTTQEAEGVNRITIYPI